MRHNQSASRDCCQLHSILSSFPPATSVSDPTTKPFTTISRQASAKAWASASSPLHGDKFLVSPPPPTPTFPSFLVKTPLSRNRFRRMASTSSPGTAANAAARLRAAVDSAFLSSVSTHTLEAASRSFTLATDQSPLLLPPEGLVLGVPSTLEGFRSLPSPNCFHSVPAMVAWFFSDVCVRASVTGFPVGRRVHGWGGNDRVINQRGRILLSIHRCDGW